MVFEAYAGHCSLSRRGWNERVVLFSLCKFLRSAACAILARAMKWYKNSMAGGAVIDVD